MRFPSPEAAFSVEQDDQKALGVITQVGGLMNRSRTKGLFSPGLPLSLSLPLAGWLLESYQNQVCLTCATIPKSYCCMSCDKRGTIDVCLVQSNL